MKKTILIASKNKAKVGEYKKFLDLGDKWQVLSLKDLGLDGEVEENGQTFAENAYIKAKYWADRTGYLTIGDDGGLSIDILDGKPGVFSRRWPYAEQGIYDKEATDEELVNYTLKSLQGIPLKKRTAKMMVAIVLHNPREGKYWQKSNYIEGIILEKAGPYPAGYPYRGLFYLPQYDKLFSELTELEHLEINHRIKPIKELAEIIANIKF